MKTKVQKCKLKLSVNLSSLLENSLMFKHLWAQHATTDSPEPFLGGDRSS